MWGRFGVLQRSHSERGADSRRQLEARRLRLFALEVLRLGTAMRNTLIEGYPTPLHGCERRAADNDTAQSPPDAPRAPTVAIQRSG